MANPTYNNSHQGKATCNVAELRRNPNDIQNVATQIMDSGNQNVANVLLPNSQGTTANPLLSYQSTSFSGLYSSPGFNSSFTGYENNLQWLTDNRIQNQHNQLPGNVISDKNINTTTSHTLPPTTSHSCCVNRYGVLDSLGMGSPLPPEQVKSTCDVSSFQTKSNLPMNMIDPIQSWLNLQIPAQMTNNQQYCKYNDRPMVQNYNIPVSMPTQLNLPLIDQTDLKQNDMCIQSPDTCFENVSNNSNKHIDTSMSSLKHNSFTIESKQGTVTENNMLKQQNTYQSSIMPKDWKSTFQSMQNYISSPNMFSAVNEQQENFLFAQYNMPPSKLYYSTSDNYSSFVNNKTSQCMTQTKPVDNHSNHNRLATMQNSFIDQNHTKLYNNQQTQIKEAGKLQQSPSNHGNNISSNYDMSDCCHLRKGRSISSVENNRFSITENRQENKSNENAVPLNTENLNDKISFKNSEAVSSESEESNIIVEESDDIGEIESEISIEEIKKSYCHDSGSEVLLRCLVCNIATSPRTPASQFIHINASFPLTAASRTPVRTKLEQLVPSGLQHYLQLTDSFVCRRCLSLVETVEVLEVKLISARRTITDSFLKTVRQLVAGDYTEVAELHPPDDGEKLTNSLDLDQQSVENEHPDDNKEGSDCENEVEFKCSYCGKILSSQKNLELHLQQHTKDFRYYCERCGKGFPLKSTLEKHLNWHNGTFQDIKVLCEICGETFPTRYLFISHHTKIHSGSFDFTCDTCGKGFTRKLSLEVHSHKHTGERPFICEYCGLTFISEANLKSHIKQICTQDMSHKCDICGKSFLLESELTRHKSQHSGEYRLTCAECGKGFNKPYDLSQHARSHSEEKLFKCTSCEKSFKLQKNLNYHVRAVHERVVFKCTVCGRIFPQQQLLSEHMTEHSDERPYRCERCGKSYAHQTTYISHLKTHTGKVKLKTCQVCGKDIKTRMSIHMRSHTGVKPYQCSYCPLAFTVGTTLKTHIQKKHCKT